jgi:WXXGXW repeat (2 copies)
MRIVQIRSLLSALILAAVLPLAAHAQIGIGVSINVAPPEIPVYEQPPIPEDGYIWTPGFWQWGPDGYFWVPGTWIEPPSVGLLWTPGYWGWADGAYLFHGGYWGEHVGFYGGVNYGYGYGGAGFEGGYWQGGHMYYNRSVMNVTNVHVTNVYNKTVIVNNNTRVSFNGGTGGVRAQPTQTELAAAHERHVAPTPMQTQHVHAASSNRALLASVNHGAPAIAATSKPGVFAGKGVVSANHAATPATHSPTPAEHSETHAPAPAHTAPPHPAVTNQAAPRPENHAMTAHPAAPAPRPAAPVAPPHPPAQQHAAPAPKSEPKGSEGREERHN